MLSIDADGSLALSGVVPHFPTPNCEGTAYFHAGEPRVAGILYSTEDEGGVRLFAIDTTAPQENMSISSVLAGGTCTEKGPEDTPVRAGREVVLPFTFPLTTPLYIGLMPE